MGVVYKLKQEVIEFIVQQKTENPSLGCRKLSDLASERFQKKISKSSVNAILKSSNLSSSVGRRSSTEKKAKKFKIPVQKKEHLFEQVNKVSPQEIESPSNTVAGLGEEKVGIYAVDEGKAQLRDPSLAKKRTDNFVPDAFMKKVEAARAERESFKSGTYKGVGIVFLKAAQWEIAGRSMLGELFKKHSGDNFSKNLDDACDCLLALKAMGLKSLADASSYESSGLWPLSDVDPGKNLPGLFNWTDDVSFSNNLSLEYLNEKKQTFLNIKGYHIFLEDGRQLTVDAQMGSFWRRSFDSSLSLPMNRAIANLSEQFISNVKPAILRVVPQDAEVLEHFYEFTAVFGGIPGKKMVKVSIFNEEGENMAEFSSIPGKKKNFLIGVSPSHKIFHEITKATKWAEKKSFYHKVLDRIFYYTETKTDIASRHFSGNVADLRVVTVWTQKKNDPVWAILTNHSELKAEEVLGLYMLSWPNLRDSYGASQALGSKGPSEGKSDFKTQDVQKQSFTDVQAIIGDYKNNLQERCLVNYFDKSDANRFVESIYSLNGKLSRIKGTLGVYLEVPSDFPHYDVLQQAIQRVNERKIVDHTGHWLFIETIR